MTPKLKTGFTLSIIGHILAWCPVIYWVVTYLQYLSIGEDSINSSFSMNYYLFSFLSSVAIALCIISLILIRSRDVEPEAKKYKLWSKILAISGLALVGGCSILIGLFALYAIVLILGL
jgi:hypothetical protein